MKTELKQEQIDFYQREGWIIVEDFLDAAELQELCDGVEESVRQMGNRKITGKGNEMIVDGRDEYYDRVFLQRLNMWKINPTVRKYMLDPGLGEMLCRLSGIDGIRVWHDQTLQKRPWDNPTSWHIDVPNWSFHSPNSISMWIAMDDATVQNGCLYYIPGSHKIAKYEKKGHFRHQIDFLFEEYPEFRRIEPVAAAMKAGSAGIHNGLMAHAAGTEHDPFPAPRHDLRLHARRCGLQRHSEHPHRRAGGLSQPRRPARRREPDAPGVVAPQGQGLMALARFGNGSQRPGFPGSFSPAAGPRRRSEMPALTRTARR